MQRQTKILITAIIVLLLALVSLVPNSVYPFTKSYECKKLMQPLQNVTLGQGENYNYKDGNCKLWYYGSYGYGDWIVNLEELKKNNKQS